jgi:LacI family transcriptional regulator
MDERSGAFKATRHLIELGHRNIAIIDGPNAYNKEKREGYQQALTEAGLPFDTEFWAGARDFSAEKGFWAVDALMQSGKRPTALFAVNDSLALGALRWCFMHKLRVPEDLAIVGMDNIELAEFATVPLSSVSYGVETVTRMAVDRLMRLISAGDQLPAPRVTRIDPNLVIRESTMGIRG